MIDINPFKGFFSSLAQISPFNFEIWNEKALLFSSGVDRPETANPNEIKELSKKIMSRPGFQHVSSQDQNTIFGVPLMNGEGSIGSLIAYGSNSKIPSHVKEMETFLTHMAGIIEDKWGSQEEIEVMAGELSGSFEDLYLYSRLATQIKTLKFSESMLRNLIRDLLEAMRADLAFARLPDRKGFNMLVNNTEILQTVSDPNDFVDHLLINSIPSSESSLLEESYFIVNNSRLNPDYKDLHPDPFRFLTVKMQHNKELYGWLGLVSFDMKKIFQRSELRLLGSVAEQMAVVIANTDLYRDMEHFVINVVKSLVYAIEAKDVYTRGHSERVNRYCMMIADRLNMEEEPKDALHWASILHDVGKIGIAEAILNKPGRLSDEEYGLIKEHSKKGYGILKPIRQLWASLPAILHHHERYDGGGYPQGLKGEEIPLSARIIAIADTFDAITSDRAYRPSKSREEALAIMEQVAGSQLDSNLFEIFKEGLNSADSP